MDDLGVSASDADKSVTLSDGRVVSLRRPKGRDLLEATRRANRDVSRIQFELIGLVAEVDGEPLDAEALMDMDLEDVTSLMTAYRRTPGFLPSSPGTSSTSRE